MADQQQQPHQQQANILSATYPAPPPFYKYFTADNLARLKELQQSQRRDNGDGDGAGASVDTVKSEELPLELRYLIPPPPPTSGTYRNFGDPYNVIDTLPNLQEQGIEQLYPSPPDQPQLQPSQEKSADVDAAPATTSTATVVTDRNGTQSEWTLDRAFYLQKIAKSLLLNFMELVGVLSVDPSQYGSKIESLRTLFINAHHLLNEYRPHQARETLILMMEEQLERTRAETAGILAMKQKVEDMLQTLASELEGDTRREIDGADDSWKGEIGEVAEMRDLKGMGDKEQLERERGIWEALRMEFST